VVVCGVWLNAFTWDVSGVTEGPGGRVTACPSVVVRDAPLRITAYTRSANSRAPWMSVAPL
jgi:hypothetical protein